MREQLIRYVELLFAGAENAGDIQQEILQNTLDRYDDLIAQGKTPEAAYRLAISGIGDINEILGSAGGAAPKATGAVPPAGSERPSMSDDRFSRPPQLRPAGHILRTSPQSRNPAVENRETRR